MTGQKNNTTLTTHAKETPDMQHSLFLLRRLLIKDAVVLECVDQFLQTHALSVPLLFTALKLSHPCL